MVKDYDTALSTIYNMLDNGLMSSDDVMEFFFSHSNQSVEVLQEIIDIFDSRFDADKNEDLDSDSDDDEESLNFDD
tara:strand:+ start:338 stop:565 length:228 start_codon:yes stop_codon:yes gene_type:complete